ncbi:hypothetical protein FLGSB24_41250 [Flavobacterium sp. GSB-24]|jgi:hypothetical protein|nr:hypothetical protein FLGSB24_41250 [Flavobacterium sp. GSB-24]
MRIIVLTGILLLSMNSAHSQKVNVYPNSSYVQENLDLNAVGLLFEESADLADFEKKINYPQDRISNLDLNDDGKVDYLKVSDKIENNIQIIKIQSEISPNIYQDVASINIILKNQNRSANSAIRTDRQNINPKRNADRERSSYYNDSGLRAKDIILPFMYTALNIYLTIRR